MTRKQSVGTCMFCGKEMAKGGLTRHLATCEQRQEAIRAAEGRHVTSQQLFYLYVQDAYRPGFWLHLEVNGGATLRKLDEYLRAIWLECCGHLSMFAIGGWGGDEMPISWKIEHVFSAGDVVTHIYDFGSSSETLIKPAGVRQGKPLTRYPVYLLARNKMPEAVCAICAKPAGRYCIQCLIEKDEWVTLCDIHADEHPHHDYGEPMPLVNSPRIGICGYDGPAEPPY